MPDGQVVTEAQKQTVLEQILNSTPDPTVMKEMRDSLGPQVHGLTDQEIHRIWWTDSKTVAKWLLNAVRPFRPPTWGMWWYFKRLDFYCRCRRFWRILKGTEDEVSTRRPGTPGPSDD